MKLLAALGAYIDADLYVSGSRQRAENRRSRAPSDVIAEHWPTAGSRPCMTPEPRACDTRPRMPSFPRVVSASQVALKHEGIALGPLSIELWDDHVVVNVAGVPVDAAAERRERDFRDAHRAWAHEVAAAGDVAAAPSGPLHPLGEVLEVLRISLADDQGTAYQWKGSGRGGTTWAFTGDVRFEPGVAADAAELLVTLSVTDGDGATVRVPLR